MLIPEIPCWQFIEAISELEAEPLFGLKAATEIALPDTLSLNPLLRGCTSLKLLLERMCAVVYTQSNVSHMSLKDDGDIVWFRESAIHSSMARIQGEQYTLAGMIQMVQLAAGADWYPEETHFSVDFDRHIINTEFFGTGKVLFSQPYIAIAIPKRLLPLPVNLIESGSDNVILSSSGNSLSDDLKHSLNPYLGNRKLTQNFISEIVGMSFRSIQRKLSINGETYSDVLDQLRFEKARGLLIEDDANLLDITFQLGYENSSTFSRAFRRWSGVTPREYRILFRQ